MTCLMFACIVFEHQDFKETEKFAEDIYEMSKEGNILHKILREEILISREKRNTLMKKNFRLCKIRNVKIEKPDGGTIIGAFFFYLSPEDQLLRLLDDASTFQQYLMSGRENKLYAGLGKIA